MRDLNPHLVRRSGSDYPCPHAICDGTGFILDDEANVARPCRCRDQRIARARSRSLDHEIPKKFQHVGFDRAPVKDMDQMLVREVRSYCLRIDDRIDAGKGIWFHGPRGTGKTTLAMLISQHALKAHRSVAIYTAPRLLADALLDRQPGPGRLGLGLGDGCDEGERDGCDRASHGRRHGGDGR